MDKFYPLLDGGGKPYPTAYLHLGLSDHGMNEITTPVEVAIPFFIERLNRS